MRYFDSNPDPYPSRETFHDGHEYTITMVNCTCDGGYSGPYGIACGRCEGNLQYEHAEHADDCDRCMPFVVWIEDGFEEDKVFIQSKGMTVNLDNCRRIGGFKTRELAEAHMKEWQEEYAAYAGREA